MIEADIIDHPLGKCVHELVKLREADADVLSGMQWAADLCDTHLMHWSRTFFFLLSRCGLVMRGMCDPCQVNLGLPLGMR
jgi:hypothetical protein